MTEALFGLAGVLIGGLLSVLTNIFLEDRRDMVAAKVGARLIRDDLHRVAIYLENAIIEERWINRDVTRIEILLWQEQRYILAKVLKYPVYGKIVSSMIAVEKINGWLASDNENLHFEDKTKKQFQFWLDDIREALQALMSVAED